jgi:glycosyltransferase involved in cell wall biosynthesis
MIYIVGRDPSPLILQLATDRVIVTGEVEDVRWYFSRARVFVAPVRFGAGQKIKILEAFANAAPVVATHEANRGIDAVDGESIVVRSAPTEMAQSILELLDDEQKRHELGQNAYQFAKKNFARESSVEALVELYHQAVQNTLTLAT